MCYPYRRASGEGLCTLNHVAYQRLAANCEGAVTAPITPGIPSTPLTPPPQETLHFPLAWLLEHGVAPIQYRAVTEVARLSLPNPARFGILPYSYEPALLLAFTQGPDTTWGGTMLTTPSPRAERFQGVGAINAVRRLLEYGWDRESPPLVLARRTLFRLLAEDEDPAYLFELAPRGHPNPEVVRYGRGILREAAAAALAQAGYENDPRLRGAARRILERVDNYLRSPLAQKPFVRVGNSHVLAPGATPPSIYTIAMLAFMPNFRSEHHYIVERLYTHLTQPEPRTAPASVVAGKVVEEPHLVLGDPLPHRNAADGDIPAALHWLELFARLGLLRRNEGWMKLYDRLLDDRDSAGVWRMPKRSSVGLRSTNPFMWPFFPLASNPSADELSAEVTFRLGLIGRYAGRQIEVG